MSARTCGVVLLAAGLGSRFGEEQSKILAPLRGQPMFLLPLKTIAGLEFVREVVIVARAESINLIEKIVFGKRLSRYLAKKQVKLCEGGSTRTLSVAKGLEKLSSHIVLIHDASRPLATKSLFERIYISVGKGIGAVPVIPLSDSVLELGKRGLIASYLKRDRIRCVQTPQGFVLKEYADAMVRLGRKREYSDDGSLFLDAQYRLKIVPGERTNIKITYPEDLIFASQILRKNLVRL